MTQESRLELHLLLYKIVSLRMVCGDYEDTPSMRSKLELQTSSRIARLSQLNNTSELEEALSLYELYVEQSRNRTPVSLRREVGLHPGKPTSEAPSSL